MKWKQYLAFLRRLMWTNDLPVVCISLHLGLGRGCGTGVPGGCESHADT